MAIGNNCTHGRMPEAGDLYGMGDQIGLPEIQQVELVAKNNLKIVGNIFGWGESSGNVEKNTVRTIFYHYVGGKWGHPSKLYRADALSGMAVCTSPQVTGDSNSPHFCGVANPSDCAVFRATGL